MRARVVKIGNSQGIRIPKPLLEQTGIMDDVELEVELNAAGHVLNVDERRLSVAPAGHDPPGHDHVPVRGHEVVRLVQDVRGVMRGGELVRIGVHPEAPESLEIEPPLPDLVVAHPLRFSLT